MGMSESMDNIQKPTTAKEVLTILREFLINRPLTDGLLQTEQRKVWDILSALRGPDNGDDTVKYATTSIVRRIVFGDLSEAQSFAIFQRDSAMFAGKRKELEEQQHKVWNHFTSHAQQAFKALGLNWEGVNDNG